MPDATRKSRPKWEGARRPLAMPPGARQTFAEPRGDDHCNRLRSVRGESCAQVTTGRWRPTAVTVASDGVACLTNWNFLRLAIRFLRHRQRHLEHAVLERRVALFVAHAFGKRN